MKVLEVLKVFRKNHRDPKIHDSEEAGNFRALFFADMWATVDYWFGCHAAERSAS